MTGSYRGVILILIAYILMTGETVLIHQVGDAATPLQFILMRNIGSLILVAFLARHIGWRVLHTGRPGLQVVRSLLTMVSLWCLFYGFAVLPLADATAITYTRAVFLILLAVAVLGERISFQRWVAVGAGVLGALLVIQPGFGGWRPEYLVALAGSALNAGSMVATKALEQRDPTLTTMAWLTGLSTVACLPALFQPWPDQHLWPWLLGVAVLGSSGLWAGLLAIRAADLSVLAPFDYSRLVMAAGFGLLLFGEVPGLATLAGAAIIALACAAATMTGRTPAAVRRSFETMPAATLPRSNSRTLTDTHG
jgi:drug/metabolite transporter (DMT)-like permease